MPTRLPFDYALLRVVPRVDRGEFINAGVLVYCLQQDFLQARTVFQPDRLCALWPRLDLDLVQTHLAAFERIAAGDPSASAVAKLPQKERFHWLVAPRSTILQASPVHAGLCEDPNAALGRLLKQMVCLPGG